MTEGPVVAKVEPREGDMAGTAGREVKGGGPRAQNCRRMTGLLHCKMVSGGGCRAQRSKMTGQ